MKFKEFEIVRLLQDHPEANLRIGDLGVIIMVYTEPNEAYEVEFTDIDGKTKSQLALLPTELESP